MLPGVEDGKVEVFVVVFSLVVAGLVLGCCVVFKYCCLVVYVV